MRLGIDSRQVRVTRLVFLSALALLVLAAPAYATLPGTNGKIAFERSACGNPPYCAANFAPFLTR